MLNSFWWGRRSDDTRSINRLSWDKTCIPQKFGGLGFRDFTAFNVAMLGKQGWRLVSKPTSLVNRIFKAKYYPKGEFMEAQLGNAPSFVWRSIWHSQLVLQKGLRWKVGDGRLINIWRDPWLREDCNFNLETPVIPNLRHLTVHDLLDPHSRTWNMELIDRTFSSRDRAYILNLPPPLDSGPDRLIWHWSHNGIYTVKSSYTVILD